jgi:hypothetical protein
MSFFWGAWERRRIEITGTRKKKSSRGANVLWRSNLIQLDKVKRDLR